MAKSFKYNNDTYLDSTGIVHNGELLSNILNYKVDYKDNKEIATNEYVNGKRVYAKRFTNIGLAANTLVQLKHSLTNCNEIWVDMTNSYIRSTNSDGRCFPLVQVYYTSTSSNSFFQVYVDDTNINLMSNGGWGTGWKISIVLKYTKK